MGERVSIQTERYQIIQESGLRPPSLRINYSSPSFQEKVLKCFGDLLPRIKFTDTGIPYFENRDSENRETCILATKIKSFEEIPRSEIIRLLEGWLRLQTLANAGQNVDFAEASMMQAFLLPDPDKDIRHYRIYEGHDGTTKLHVLWGFATKAKPSSAILAEYAIGTLLGLDVEQLGVLAEKECDPDVYQKWLLSTQFPTNEKHSTG